MQPDSSPAEVIRAWMREGVRFRTKAAGLQSDLFSSDPTPMVAVSYGRECVTVSESELARITAEVNRERAERGETLTGVQSPMQFGDCGPTIKVNWYE